MYSDDDDRPSISEFFKGKCLFITGASGFLGKMLLEKILRSCEECLRIYVLIRPDKETVAKRRENLLKGPVFDEVRLTKADKFATIVPVKGDLTKPDFGLSFNNLKAVRNNVEIVFHCGGLVRFNANQRSSVEVNFLGAKYLLQLCKQMKKLKAIVHVSSAYTFCNLLNVDETINPPPGDLPDHILELLEQGNLDEFDRVATEEIKTRPSVYHFSKAMAEKHIKKTRGKLPIAIVRPSIITAAFWEPIPGWVDNRNGPTGLLIACCQGFVRTLYADPNVNADWIPVDIVVNTLIASAYYIATAKPTELLIVNCASSEFNPLKWGDVERLCYPLILKYPTNSAFRYPNGSFKDSYWKHQLYSWAFHWIPAYMLDFMDSLLGREAEMVDRVAGAHSAMKNFEYFLTTNIVFRSRNMQMLEDYMHDEDKGIFYTDICVVDWNDYMENYVLGTRRHVLNEPDSTLPAARRTLRRLRAQSTRAQYSLLATPIFVAGLATYWFMR